MEDYDMKNYRGIGEYTPVLEYNIEEGLNMLGMDKLPAKKL